MTRSDDQQNVRVCRAIWIVKFSSLSLKVLLGAAAWKTDVEVEITIVKRSARDQAMNKMLAIVDPEIYSGRCSTRFFGRWMTWGYNSRDLRHQSTLVIGKAIGIEKVGDLVRHGFELLEGRIVAVALNTGFALVTGDRFYVSTLDVCSWQNCHGGGSDGVIG